MKSDDDNTLTLRAPRGGVAFGVAVAAHVVALLIIQALPEPKKPEQRIQMTVQSKPPPPPTSPVPPSATPPPPKEKQKQTKKTPTPPQTSPVVPELPPSLNPPENRAQLPVVEQSPEPAPPP